MFLVDKFASVNAHDRVNLFINHKHYIIFMAEIYQLPEGGSSSGVGNIPFSIPIGGNGGMFGNGQTNLMDLFGFAIVASMFPNLFGNRFGQGGMNGGGMNTDLVMQAVTAQGEANRAAVQTLASSVGQDFNVVYGAVQNVQGILSSLAASNGMGFLQVINAIQSGNSAISQQFCQCCCDQKQGYQAQIRTIEQTNQLGSQADRNTASVVAAINALQTNMTKEFCDVKEREMQEKINTQADIITQLRNAADNANQTNQIIGYVNSVVTPLQRTVDKISANQLPTVNVQWPQLTAVNTTPYAGNGFYGNGFWGNGFGGNIVF